MIICYAGPPEDGEEALRPLREFGPPALDMVQPMPYTQLQQLIEDGYPHGMRNYCSNQNIKPSGDVASEARPVATASGRR